MTKNKLIGFIFLLLISLNLLSQQVIKGKLLNSTTKEPIEYANIGLQKRNIGTISNKDGSFSLNVPSNFVSDTLIFSAIGFSSRIIPLKYFEKDKGSVIYLTEKVIALNEVVVSSKREKPIFFELGNPDYKGGVIQTDTLYAGRSVSLLIENTESNIKKGITLPAFIEKATLRIFRNNLESFKYRIRINEVDQLTGHPGKDLLNKSIVMQSSMKNGWLEFDLSKLNIEIDQPFFVTFEQILDLTDRTLIADNYKKFLKDNPKKVQIDTVEVNGRKEVRQILKGGGIDLAGTFIGIAVSKSASEQFTSYVRETSFGEWRKVRGIVAATVTLSNFPNISKATDTGCKNIPSVCKAEKICKTFLEQYGVNGMQVCVSKKGKIVWADNWGYADISNKVPVTDLTKFRINSISKSLTSLALLKLVSEGKLDLDSPIQKYIPEYPQKSYTFTTRQLAGHLAGFRDYDENNLSDYIQTRHYENSIEAINIFENDTLLFKPDTKFHYSTFGWNLIGAIIEKVSGKDYLTYMTENIWKPLALENTCGDNIKDKISNRSKFYDITGEENELGDLSYKYSGGGLLSTSKDLVKIGNEILFGSYFDKNQKSILFQSQYTSDNKATGYGLGWYIGKDKNGHRIWYHSGDSFSSSSYLIIYPDDDIVISFLANSQIGTALNIEQVGELFYEK
ncbi:MAG: serine hydrolase [Bacteroidetes bacterium]|nr:serine hydrolase [Bacteroidota bacterium]